MTRSTRPGYSEEPFTFVNRAARSARLAVQIAFVLASALLLFSTAAMAQRRQPCASTEATTPSGLAVVLPSGKYQSLNLEALNNAFISGVSVQINWRDIEPVEGKPDWSKLDELFAATESSKKWVQLDIFPGFFSPAWALEGAKTDMFPIPYGPGHGNVTSLPMPWDEVYLDRWFAFVKQIGKRYGTSPAFRMIAASGPTSVSEEMTLPSNSPPAIKKWLSDGYTPAKYLAAWEEAFHVYADAFPNQCVSIAAPGLPILEQGESGLPARMRAKQDIVERAVKVFGKRLAIQSNDLHAGHAQVEAFDGTDFIKSYTGRIITGFEMRGGSQGPVPSKVMGAEGDPPLALRRSIDKGMAPNDAGRHVNFLEIYAGDVLPADMQPVLQYAASLFAQSSENQDSRTNSDDARGNKNQDNQQQAQARPQKPSGISVVNRIDADRVGKLFDTSNPTQNAYTNQNTSGVTFRTSWADVEPEEGRFDFSKIDTVFANAEKNGKWVDLILIPGFGTPGWAMKGVQSGMFAIQYGAGTGNSLPLPVPWDQTYLSRWFTFLKAIADRYAGKTSFRKIGAAGPTSVSSEMSLPDSQDDIVQWEKLGYTSQKYIDAWKQTFGAYSSTFPHQYFSLSLHPALPIPDPSQKANVREQIVSLGLRYPNQFALESDGLNSSRTDKTLGLVKDHCGQVVSGFMMSTSATDKSQRMGAEGDPPLALRRSIDVGMEPNSAGRHVDFLEIYEGDVLADEMQTVLRYGISLFAADPAQQKADMQGQDKGQSDSKPRDGRRAAVEESSSSDNPDSPASRPGQPRALTETVAPGGLVVVRHVNNSPQQDQALYDKAMKNPLISGVGFQIHWSDIEPVQGKPDWSKLDELFAASEKSNKWVQLCIYAGFFAPDWALEGVKIEQFPVQYGPGKGTVMSLPMPWDEVYLTRWLTFLKQLSARYGKSPVFKVIAADGPTSVSEEMTLPRDPTKWRNDSYTPSKYIGAYQKVFQAYAADFPDQFISLAVGDALNINDQGKMAPGEGERTRQTIIDQAMGLLGRRFLLENHDLHAGPVNQQDATTFVMGYSGRVITGLEMRCASELGTCSAAMGAEGDPPLALRRSIDLGMQPNNAGQHVYYLEIYEPDVIADEMQSVLGYGASLLAPPKPAPRPSTRH